MSGPHVIIAGTGLSALLTGLLVMEGLPRAEITLLAAEPDRLLGGQLASWDEGGYPVEHGLHLPADRWRRCRSLRH